MSNNIVMAFRKRLKNRGYTNIHIYYEATNIDFKTNKRIEIYKVSALEPLTRTRVTKDMTEIEMYKSMRF